MGKDNLFYALKLILICFLYFHKVYSLSVSENDKESDFLIDKIKVCPTVDVIKNSNYTKTCSTFKYPEEFLKESNLALCMLVLDTTNKICEYFSKLGPEELMSETNLLLSSVQQLDTNIEKYEHNNISDVCKNITPIFNKLNHLKVEESKDPMLISYLNYSQKILLTKENCYLTCSSINTVSKINQLCTYLLWANEFFTILKPIKPIKAENDHEGKLPEKQTQHNAKVVPEENNEKNKEKQESKINDRNEKNKKIDTPNIVSQSESQQNKQNLPTSASKKSDDVPIDHINTSNNEAKDKPKDQKPVDESNNEGSLLVPPKEEDAANIVDSKKNEGDIDNGHQLPPDEANQDGDSISAEDHQNRKENDDLEEGIDQENGDKEPKDTNPGVEVPVKNPDENEEFPQRQKVLPHSQTLKEEEESYFFTYFSVITLLCIVLYIAYHNKQKILAILLEGRRSRRGRGSRRRPSTASYRKLDCNLEEAVTSQCNSNKLRTRGQSS